jgi:hypothetical protein
LSVMPAGPCRELLSVMPVSGPCRELLPVMPATLLGYYRGFLSSFKK